jgi:hypothetical protein
MESKINDRSSFWYVTEDANEEPEFEGFEATHTIENNSYRAIRFTK